MSETPTLLEDKPKRSRRLGAIVGAGLVAGLIAAFAVGGVASAQSTTITTEVTPPGAVQLAGQTEEPETDEAHDEEEPDGEDFDLSVEDEALFEQFEQCLQDAGLDTESLDGEAETSDAALDAAFETCDPILDDLSEDFDHDFDELSPEDEAVFDRFDQCLTDAGLTDDFFDTDDDTIDEDAIDQIFEGCEPILDGLSEDAQELFEHCDDE